MPKLTWERIDDHYEIDRAKVFGGWLVTSVDQVMTPTYEGYPQPINKTGYEWRTSICFVPDPNHEWKLEN